MINGFTYTLTLIAPPFRLFSLYFVWCNIYMQYPLGTVSLSMKTASCSCADTIIVCTICIPICSLFLCSFSFSLCPFHAPLHFNHANLQIVKCVKWADWFLATDRQRTSQLVRDTTSVHYVCPRTELSEWFYFLKKSWFILNVVEVSHFVVILLSSMSMWIHVRWPTRNGQQWFIQRVFDFHCRQRQCSKWRWRRRRSTWRSGWNRGECRPLLDYQYPDNKWIFSRSRNRGFHGLLRFLSLSLYVIISSIQISNFRISGYIVMCRWFTLKFHMWPCT